jgi:hypothetical protein
MNAPLEVLECDNCGMTDAFESERDGEVAGWKFTQYGTACPSCVNLIGGSN